MLWANIIAGVAAIAAVGTVVIALMNRKKIAEIHVLVNQRLDDALKEIEELKK